MTFTRTFSTQVVTITSNTADTNSIIKELKAYEDDGDDDDTNDKEIKDLIELVSGPTVVSSKNQYVHKFTMPAKNIKLKFKFLNPNKGFWYVTNDKGEVGPAGADSQYNILHLTNAEQSTVANQSGAFTFGTAPSQFGSSVYSNVTKVIFDSEFAPTTTAQLFGSNNSYYFSKITKIENIIFNEKYTEDVASTGHNYDHGVVTTNPTCTEKGVKTFSCTNKKNKLTFMKMFSIDQSKYPDVNAIEIKVNDDVNTLTFSVSLKGGEEHRCSVSDFGTTKIDYLDKQLAAVKSYYAPDATMKKIIDLFEGLNYTHLMYDEEFDKANPVGYEKFTEDYFISGYSSEYIAYNSSALIKCSGMIGFDKYQVRDDVTLDGAYYAYVYKDSYSLVTGFPYNEDSYIPNVYVYPTFLEAFKNSQYFESAGTEGSYFTNKLSVISDFCTNFQLWEGLQDNNFVPCGLFVTYDKSYKNQDTVTFSIQYDYFGVKGTSDFIFSDFGKTSEEIMNKKYAEALAPFIKENIM